MKDIYKDKRNTSLSKIYQFLSTSRPKNGRENGALNTIDQEGSVMEMNSKETGSLRENEKRAHEETIIPDIRS